MMLTRPRFISNPEDGAFWDYADAEELRLQKCSECARFRYPAAPCCPRCLSERSDWTAVEGRGVVRSKVVFHRQYFESMPAPYAVVAVELPEGPIMIGNVPMESAAAVDVGSPVEVFFEPCEFSDGAVGRLPQWRPLV